VFQLAIYRDGQWLGIKQDGTYTSSVNGGKYIRVRFEGQLLSLEEYCARTQKPLPELETVKVSLIAADLSKNSPSSPSKAPPSDIKPLAGTGDRESRERAILRERTRTYPLGLAGGEYEEEPSPQAPYRAGRLRPAYVEDGLKALNFVRFLAGLPADVELKDEFTELCQYGSTLNAAAGKIDHSPDRPADMPEEFYEKARKGTSQSNLFGGWGAGPWHLDSAVILNWADDSDSANRDRLGHRRWLLNPGMRYTGFGQVVKGGGTFSSVYAFDQSRAEKVPYQAVCYPAGAAFPGACFAGAQAWSVSLNPDLYQSPVKGAVTVTLTCLDTGKIWRFSQANTADFFTVDTGGFGIPNCIIFIPSGVEAYTGAWRVEVQGLTAKDGKPATLAYETTFFHWATYRQGRW